MIKRFIFDSFVGMMHAGMDMMSGMMATWMGMMYSAAGFMTPQAFDAYFDNECIACKCYDDCAMSRAFEEYMCEPFWYSIRCWAASTYKPTMEPPVINVHTTAQTTTQKPTTTPTVTQPPTTTKSPHTKTSNFPTTSKTDVHGHTDLKTTTISATKPTTTTRPTTTSTSTTTTEKSTTVATTAPPMIVPSCAKFCAIGAVAKNKPVPNGHAHGLCAQTSPEAFSMTCCKMGDTDTWKQGDHVMSVCSFLPHYIPVAKFSAGKVIPGTAGVFVSCLESSEHGFMFIHQDCNKSPTITKVSEQGTNGLIHPEQYHVITV